MAKPRKKHVQLELPKAPKLDKNGQHRGGKRDGAGRKPKNGIRAGESHDRRPALTKRTPIHVTLRVARDLDSLRRRHIYHAVRLALGSIFERDDFKVVHLSLQHDHIHMLVEADNRRALTNGMRTLNNVIARLINDAVTRRTGRERTGTVFADRYHEEVIRTPTQARYALRYVVNNWRKHGDHRGRTWLIDPFSSAAVFEGWTELADSPTLFRTRETYKRLPVWRARTWLLREGWRRAGAISVYDVPSA